MLDNLYNVATIKCLLQMLPSYPKAHTMHLTKCVYFHGTYHHGSGAELFPEQSS